MKTYDSELGSVTYKDMDLIAQGNSYYLFIQTDLSIYMIEILVDTESKHVFTHLHLV